MNKAQVTTANDTHAAIEAWRNLLGAEYVLTNAEKLRVAESATFATHQTVNAVLMPGTENEVVELVRIANRHRTPIYPVSRGRNWGLGSAVPVVSGCSIIDLRRLNRILNFDDELGHITIEPGVTFQQVADFLRERKATHFLSTIGGPPDASVIGNCVERGTGMGPLGEREIWGGRVVLGTGEIVSTGFAQFENSKLAELHRSGLGPSIDGLFCQSNFGIVTKITMALAKRPNYVQSVLFSIDSEHSFDQVVVELREQQSQYVVLPFCLGLWNQYKFIAAREQFPNLGTTPGSFNVAEMIARSNKRFRDAKWFGMCGLFAASRSIGRAQRAALKKAIGTRCKTLTFIDPRKIRLLEIGNLIARSLGMAPFIEPEFLDSLYKHSTLLGEPSDRNLRSMYWRKRIAVPTDIDPHRDQCGVLWMPHTVPYTAHDIRIATDSASRIVLDAGFEPNLAIINASSKYVRLLVAIMFDREIDGEDRRALECHDRVFGTLNKLGYTTFRLGIQSMKNAPTPSDSNLTLLRDLKNVCDPNGIIAPGRYSFEIAEFTFLEQPTK